MNNRYFCLIIFLAFFCGNISAQRYEILKNDVIELGARKLEDSARQYVHFTLPKNTKGFAYRFSIYKPDKVKIKDSLTTKIFDTAPEDLAMNNPLTDLIARQTNTDVIDFYIVPTLEDAKAFKQRNMFNSCLRVPNSLNYAGTTDTCTSGEQVAFCFRNMNPKKNIKIHFELVAVVNEAQPRWTPARRKEMTDMFTKKVGDICYLLTEEEKGPFAEALSQKFMTRNSDLQTKAMTQLEMQEATEVSIRAIEKTFQLRCLPRNKADKDLIKKNKKKKKKPEPKKKEKKEKKEVKVKKDKEEDEKEVQIKD
jgi:hypothetical protein